MDNFHEVDDLTGELLVSKEWFPLGEITFVTEYTTDRSSNLIKVIYQLVRSLTA